MKQLENSGVYIKEGDIINIHQTVNGCSLFYIESLEPLDIRYEYDKTRKYEYDINDLLAIEEITIEKNIHDLNYCLNQLSFFNWLENSESGNTLCYYYTLHDFSEFDEKVYIKDIYKELPKSLQLELVKEFIFEKYNLLLTLSSRTDLHRVGKFYPSPYKDYIDQQEKPIINFLMTKIKGE